MRYLYIIGNGFDIAHGIKSRYSDYRNWLKDHNLDLFNKLVATYGDEETFWWEFEKNLSNIDIDKYKEENESNYEPVRPEELNRTMKSIRWCPTASQLEDLYIRVTNMFENWVYDLETGQRKLKKRFVLKKRSALFLSFNYTSTLEDLYKVPDNKILHVHGRARTLGFGHLVLGHNIDRDSFINLYKRKHGLSDDFDIYELEEDVQNLIDQVARLYKSVGYYIYKNRKWFQRIVNVKRINIIGVSFSEVDMKYFDWIVENHKQINGVKWKVTWHSIEDKNRILEFFKRHGINPLRIKMIRK